MPAGERRSTHYHFERQCAACFYQFFLWIPKNILYIDFIDILQAQCASTEIHTSWGGTE